EDREVWLRAQQPGESGAHHLMIVGDDDPDRGGRAAHPAVSPFPGRLATTRKPPPPAGPVDSSPPTAAARSRMPSSPCPPAGGVGGGVGGGPGPLSRMRSRRA